MKKAAYIAFVSAVLAFSGWARAEITSIPFISEASAKAAMRSVHIGHVHMDYQHLNMHVSGKLPNPCYPSPVATLESDPFEPNTLVLRLSSPTPTKVCVAAIKDYEAVVNLPALAQGANLNLSDKAMYVIKTEGYEFEIQVSGSELLR